MFNKKLQNALAILLSFVLIFSNNSNTLDPIVAWAQETVNSTDVEELNAVQDNADGGEADDGEVAEPSQGSEKSDEQESHVDEGAQATGTAKQPSTDDNASSVRDALILTDSDDAVQVTDVALSYIDADGAVHIASVTKAADGNYSADLSAINLQSVHDMALTYTTHIAEGWVAGDGIKLSVPTKNLSVDTARLTAFATGSEAIESADADTSTDVANTTITYKLAAAADEASAGAATDVLLQIPLTVALEDDATPVNEGAAPAPNSSEPVDVVLQLPAGKTFTLTLSAMAAPEPENASDAGTPEQSALPSEGATAGVSTDAVSAASDEGALSLALNDEEGASVAASDAATTSVTLNKYFYDGSDSNRPMPAELFGDEGVLDIYYAVDDSGQYAKLTTAVAKTLGLENVPAITSSTNSNTSNPYVYTATGLPTTYTDAQGTTHKLAYKIAESKTVNNNDVPVVAGDAVAIGGTVYKTETPSDTQINNIKTKDFSFTLKLHNGASNWVPLANDIANILTVSTNSGTKVAISPTDIEVSTVDGVTTVTVKNLPAYSSSDSLGIQIGYKATLSDYTLDSSSTAGDEGDTYYAEYNNASVANYGSDTAAVHEGGTVDFIRKNDTTYTATKNWYDGTNYSGEAGKTTQRPDTDFYLWRYVDDGSNTFRNAAQVLDASGTPVKVSSSKVDSETIEIKSVSGVDEEGNLLDALPKYNADGYPYVYFTKESMGESSMGTYKQVYGAYGTNDDGTINFEGASDTTPNNKTRESDDTSIYNTGTVNNNLTGTTDARATKVWVAASHQGIFNQFKTTFTLQARYKNSPENLSDPNVGWYYSDDKGNDATSEGDNPERIIMWGYAPEIVTKTQSVQLPKYDGAGYELEYRWIETGVDWVAGGVTSQADSDKAAVWKTDDELGTVTGTPYQRYYTIDGINTTDANGRTDHDYYVVEETEDATDATTVTNKLQGQVDYQIEKVWYDKDGNVTTAPAGANATFNLYQDGNALTGVSPVQGTKTVTGDDGKEYTVYTYTYNDLPKYNDNGELYTYYATENQLDGYYVTYDYNKEVSAIKANDAGKEVASIEDEDRAAVISNHIGTDPSQVIRIEKKWLDDSDTAHRLPVKFAVTYKLDGAEETLYVTLTSDENWWTLVYLDAKATDINVIEYSLLDGESEYTVDYPGESTHTGSVNTTVGGSAIEGHEYVVVNEGKQDKPVDGYTNYLSSNRRVGTVNLTVEKTWNDTGASKSERPSADVALSISNASSVGATVGDNYVALTGEEGTQHYILGTNQSTDDCTDSSNTSIAKATQSVNSDTDDSVSIYFYGLPKYDMQGKVISYAVDETLGSDAATKDYSYNLTAGDYEINSNYHKVDKQSFELTNGRSATTTINIHKVWNDAYQKSLGHRSDLSLTLWQRFQNADGTFTVEKYHTYGYKDYSWASGASDTGGLTATFDNLPEYTDNGAKITYYFEEIYNNPNAVSDYDYNKVTYTGGDVFYVTGVDSNGKATGASETQPESGTYSTLLQAGGTFTNGISNTVKVEGEKVWKNIPNGIRGSITLPDIAVEVYQQVQGSDNSTQKRVATMNSAELTGVEKTDAADGVNGFLTNVDKASNSWKFVAYYYDSTKDASITANVGDKLPKYDEAGNLYVYTIRETISSNNGTANLGEDQWKVLYNENMADFTASNEYNNKNYEGQVTVTKDWSGYPEGYENNHPVVRFTLHQVYKKADGSYLEVPDGKQTATIDVNHGGANSATFKDLAVYAPDGTKYFYYVTEDTFSGLGGYTPALTIAGQSGETIIAEVGGQTQTLFQPNAGQTVDTAGTAVSVSAKNTYEQDNVALTIEKDWQDGNNASGVRPTSVTFKIYASADSQPGAHNAIAKHELADVTYTLTAAGNWQTTTTLLDGTTGALPKWAPNGMPWKYSVEETDVPEGYIVSYGNNNIASTSNNLTITMTNKYDQSVSYAKTWADSNNVYGTRPTYLKVKIQIAKVTKGAAFSDVTEDDWKDARDETDLSKTLAEYVCKQFTGNAESCQKFIATTGSGSNTASASNLPTEAQIDGTTYSLFYRIVEDTNTDNEGAHPFGNTSASSSGESVWRNYKRTASTTTVSGTSSKTTETNTLDTTSLTINKTWADSNNYWNQRGSLSFTLQYKDGDTWKEHSPKTTFTVAPSDASATDTNLWTKTISNLPKADANGKAYQWRVLETGYSRFTPSNVDGAVGAGTSETTADGYASAVTNTLNTSKIKLVKYGEGNTSSTLKNISFKVTKGSSELFVWSTDSEGRATGAGDAITNGGVTVAEDGTITGLPVGTYTFTEISTTVGNDAFAKNMVITVKVENNGSISSATATAKTNNGTTSVASDELLSNSTAEGVTTLTLTDPKAKVAVTLNKTTAAGASVDGTKFKLFKADDTQITSVGTEGVLTIANGKVDLGTLEVGSYYLMETEASSTTHLNNTAKYWFQVTNENGGKVAAYTPVDTTNSGTSTIGSDGKSLSITNDAFLAKMSFTKKDADDASVAAVAGATFKLQYSETENGSYTDLSTSISDVQGVYTANLSKKGFYKLVETAAPRGYALPKNTTVATFQVQDSDQWSDAAQNYVTIKTGEDGEADNTVSDQRVLGQVVLTKVDAAQTSTKLDGVEFKLQQSADGGTTWADVTTDYSDDAPKTGTEAVTYTTDSNGQISLKNLPWGTYRFVETASKDGYVIGAAGEETVKEFTVGATTVANKDNTPATIALSNVTNAQTSVSFNKADERGKAVSDAKLKITYVEGGETKTFGEEWTTDGKAHEVKGLVVGTEYQLIETTTPNAYLTAEPISFKIGANGKVLVKQANGTSYEEKDANVISMTDNTVKATVVLTKTIDGKTNNSLAEGTAFDLYKVGAGSDGKDAKQGSYTIGSDGKLAASDLTIGKYYFVETSAPAGVELNTDKVEFEVTHGDSGEAVTVLKGADKLSADKDGKFNLTKDNNSFKASIKFKKFDATSGIELTGAQFKLQYKAAESDTWADDATVAYNETTGYYEANVAKKGYYQLVETSAQTGYKTVEADGSVVASFQLNDNDYNKTYELKTGEGGTSKTEAADINYNSSQDGVWSWGESGLSNTRKTGSVTLLKVEHDSNSADNEYASLNGAEFTLYKLNASNEWDPVGSVLTTAKVGEQDGIITASNLEWGTYKLVETKAAPGHKLTNDAKFTREFTIDASNVSATQTFVAASSEGGGTRVENERTELRFNKVDAKNASINGVTLTVYAATANEDGSYTKGTDLLTWTRDASGTETAATTNNTPASVTVYNVTDAQSVVRGLPSGTYILSETATPDAYLTAADVAFEIATDGTVSIKGENSAGSVTDDNKVTVVVTDQLAQATLNIKKAVADNQDGSVSGVQFQLYRQNGNDWTLVEGVTATTNEQGVASITNLGVGDYKLVETQASNNTVKNTTEFFFAVDNNGGQGARVTSTTNDTDENPTVYTAQNPLTVTNNAYTSTIRFKKIDGYSGDELKDAAFTLKDELGQKVHAFEYKTEGNNAGYYVATVNHKGTFHVVETTTPQGYDKFSANSLVTFTLNDNDANKTLELNGTNAPAAGESAIKYTADVWGSAIKATGEDAVKGLKNTRTKGSVTITKSDDLGTLLPGVKFKIVGTDGEAKEAKQGQPYTAEQTTSSDEASLGKATFTDLPWGTYKVYETATIDGHKKDWTSAEGKELGTFTIGNVTTTDENGASTITFVGQGTLTGSNSTDNSLKNERTQLALGKTYENSGNPSDETVLTLTDSDKNTIATYTRKPGTQTTDPTISIKLADNLDKSGKYKYAVVEQDGNKVDVIKGLPADTYTLSETTTPAAYLTADPITITIADDGTVSAKGAKGNELKDAVSGTTVTMNNTLAKAKVVLSKTVGNQTNNALAEGTTFKLMKVDGGTETRVGGGDAVYTIGADVTLNVADLGVGNYYFQEVSAPYGTVLDTNKVEFAVTHGETGEAATVVVGGKALTAGEDGSFALTKDNNAYLSTITFTKVDGSADDAAITSAASFTLTATYKNAQGMDQTKTFEVTGKDGVYTAQVDVKGTYTLTETTAPQGYTDMPQGGSQVASFTLGDADYDKTLTLAKGAKTSVGDVNFGTASWTDKGLQNTRKTGSVSLLKVDSVDNSKGLAGAEFKLVGTSGQATGKEYTLTTGTDGLATQDGLLWGEYTLTETKAPTGYTNKGWEPKTFEIKADNLSVSFQGDENSIKNVLSQLTLDKVDDQATPAKVAGAVLTLADSDSTSVLTWTRDSQGDVSITKTVSSDAYKNLKVAGELIYGLPAGTYTLAETTTPDAYDTAAVTKLTVADDGAVTVEGTNAKVGDDKASVTVTDPRSKVEVTLQKTAPEGCAVEGAQYKLYKVGTDADTELGTYTIGSDGTISLGELYVGTYYVQEVAATYNTVLDTTTKWYFQVTNDGGKGGKLEATTTQGDSNKNAVVDGSTATVTNEVFNAGINFKKLDANDESKVVTAAEFKLKFTPEGETEAQKDLIAVAGNADGTYSASNLKKGTYELIEVSAPDGYEVVDNVTVATFTITNDQNGNDDVAINDADVVTNKPVLAALGFTKLGYTYENGKDYVVDATATTVLAGAEFTLTQNTVANTNYKWTEAQVVASASDGAVEFTNIPEGTYTLEETKTSDAYHVLWGTKINVTVNRQGEVSVDPSVLDTVVNDYARQTISFKKVADTDASKAIAGATYEIYRVGTGDAEDTLVGTRITDASGHITFEGLLPNESYRLHEKSAPDGSMLSKEDVTVNFVQQEDGSFKLNLQNKGEANGSNTADIDADGNLVWNEPQTQYEFAKVDEDGKALSGASLEVQDSTGKVVKDADGNELKWTSATEPHSVEGVLVAGQTYKLVETAAPSGYEVADPIEFSVSTEREDPGQTHTVTITMTDKKTPTPAQKKASTPASNTRNASASKSSRLSQTGDSLVMAGVVAGVAVVAAGVVGGSVYATRRRQSVSTRGKHTK